MQEINEDPEETIEPINAVEHSLPTCARCEISTACIVQQARPSWKQVFERDIYAAPSLYSPAHHIQFGSPAGLSRRQIWIAAIGETTTQQTVNYQGGCSHDQISKFLDGRYRLEYH